MGNILHLFFLALTPFSMAERGPISEQQWIQSKYFEIGVSGGTPAGINFCVGYWFGSNHDNVMTQVCAMHFGSSLYGIQFDGGKVFQNRKFFKLYWAASLRTSHIDLSGTPVDFFGIGPVIGMNWDALALEFGLYTGSGKNTQFFPYSKDPEAGSRLVIQLGFQIGFKKLFWQ